MVERVLFSPGGATEAKQDTAIAELNNIETAIAAVEAAILGLPTDALTDAELRASPVEVTFEKDQLAAKRLVVNSSGTTTVHTPAAGKRIRLYWFGLSGNPDNAAKVKVGLRFTAGGTDFVEIWISQYGGIFAHNWKGGQAYVLGGVDETLEVNLSAAQEVIVNIDYIEV